MNEKIAVRMLEKQGYRVLAVRDGRAAVAALERGRFDLVLVDIQMPEMNGYEATQAIRAKERLGGEHIPSSP